VIEDIQDLLNKAIPPEKVIKEAELQKEQDKLKKIREVKNLAKLAVDYSYEKNTLHR
jgi:hypothetical protein